MTARPRSLVGTLAACMALLATQVLVSFAAPVHSNSPCEELRAWAEPYRGSSPTLDELARFDRAHRLAIFGAIAPEVRSDLWREQLRRFESRQALSPEQRDLIRRALIIATPELYAGRADAVAAYRQFLRVVQASPMSVEHKALWTDLGAVVRVPGATVLLVPYCNCNQDQGTYGCPHVCDGTSPCTGWGPGCGFVGASVCDGMCT